MEPVADVGVFGGSGFYSLLEDATRVVVETPYGSPAAPVTVATVGGRRVAFLPRHGEHHEHVAHRVPFRANVWALRSLGVRAVLAPCSVGSLQSHLHPGHFVVVDQLVDRTRGRADTFHDGEAPEAARSAGLVPRLGELVHLPFADPYDPDLRQGLLAAGQELGITMHDGGTMVVINGPRFSTRAESRWFREMGWSVVNMTGYPEAALAAEAGLPYATVALVTDYDAGVDGHTPVTFEAVMAVLQDNVARVRELVLRTAATIDLG